MSHNVKDRNKCDTEGNVSIHDPFHMPYAHHISEVVRMRYPDINFLISVMKRHS